MAKQKSIMLLITYKCNLRCTYCYEPKLFNYKMSIATAKRVIEDQLNLIDNDCENIEIQFMGGEPLLEFGFIKEIAEWFWGSKLYRSSVMLFACTNGTLLNEEMKSWFTEHKDRFCLGLSFDGNESMQNLNRSQSSDLIDLDFFCKTWPNQNVKMTVSPDSVISMAEGVKALHNVGFKYISAELALGPKVKWTKELMSVYKDELNKLILFYLDNTDLIPFSMLRFDISAVLRKSNFFDLKTCGCGESLVCVDWNGDTYACHLFSPISLPLKKAKEAKEIYNYHDHYQFISKKCRRCLLNNICIRCHGMNYLCNDDASLPLSYQCCAAKLVLAAIFRYRKLLAERNNDTNSLDVLYKISKRLNLQ